MGNDMSDSTSDSTIRFRYQTKEFGDTDIHVRTLRDNQQFADNDDVALNLGISSAVWPLFGVIWDSGQVLAHHMYRHQIEGKHILEVGCGIGLASLVLNHRLADITATDYHPEAENFLIANTKLNQGTRIPFVRTGWADEKTTTLGEFDLIIGSDLLYDTDHSELLSGFIDQHANSQCDVIVVDPGRKQRGSFSKAMESLGYSASRVKPDNTDYLTTPFTGQILLFSR